HKVGPGPREAAGRSFRSCIRAGSAQTGEVYQMVAGGPSPVRGCYGWPLLSSLAMAPLDTSDAYPYEYDVANVGRFIVIEGGEGAGKSRLLSALGERLIASGREVVLTREP